MSMIPDSVTEAHFRESLEPSLSKAKRGYVCRIGLYEVFNYIVYKLHTGCPWKKLPIICLASPEETSKSRRKRSELVGCLLPFSQVEQGGELRSRV
jgi:hypothetical protein